MVKPGGNAAFGEWNPNSVSVVNTYSALEAYGFVGDETMFAAAYDWRLPDCATRVDQSSFSGLPRAPFAHLAHNQKVHA